MADPPSHDKAETRRHLEGYLEAYPGLRGRVCRILLLHLHTQGFIRIEEVYRRAQRAEEWNVPTDPNRPASRLWAADERESINAIVIDVASEHLTPKEVDNLVWSAHRRDEALSLQQLARLRDVPLELIAERLSQYVAVPGEDDRLVEEALEGTMVALLRRFVSNRVDYISVAKRHLKLQDLCWILGRIVSTEQGAGLIGGKAAGMVLGHAILRAEGCAPDGPPETVFLLSDAYDQFKTLNGLTGLEHQKYKAIEEIREDFRAIGEVFRNAEFPPRIADLLRVELDRIGPVPLVVRSSSLLEDSFGATFSGIYRSIFLPNTGPLEQRLQELLGAIAEIYTGVFSPDAMTYRRRHHLIDYDERMAVMIQPVVGRRRGRYFFPAYAGVAFSRNDYRWNGRIRREDGLVRIVLGLGTHAVDRVGDYARMVALKAPTMRPEGTVEEILRASQKQVDVVDLEGGGFVTIPVLDALRAIEGPVADYVSVLEPDGRLSTPVADTVLAPETSLVVTFDRLLSRGGFPERIHRILKTLEAAYGTPVDVEFAADDGHLYVVQCRPLGGDTARARTPVPTDIPPGDQLFSARRYVNNGVLERIEHIVLIDPRDYGSLTRNERHAVARGVGEVNDALQGRRFLLMGPGRWGSQDIRLGVPVTFADICNASALLEIARAAEGYVPEPSFGTHFFQDLIEASILYLPLYPDEAVFNESLLLGSGNAASRFTRKPVKALRVIDVKESFPGRSLQLAMDGEAQRALCFLR
ncbi:MAG TPA: PEP/pyruvate-binding domain-containing protein [Planctomycetota bacterium]|nr:PEP/pyruvate-binding domain-containing protein [Planctomycetota bacterium]